ncbi:NADP:D-xylose dehydrogenase [Xylona heveae TC161]|uniref:D-xylose 1-dehydrogenase (NADP(+), D-xylono-1,5-lactone-forming) n=1 Tax=Xylona heveae (strain CBS 132557 / TC161) TaxID=1328760 RepID=A0A165F8E7_XYLHT|nr:NADP:D-xylose dehydrogenase [Xylona heveae TC161]KZF20697.1 NADP:D-xylose dehydrogenase [Xylona heveae TC161]
MSSKSYTLRWGILATGGIAKTFTTDLLVNPTTRDVHDVTHAVVAAASSTSAERARSFLSDCGAPSSAAAYGSYAELVADPNIDIIYVATPHSHHFQNAMLCLKAGKNVLCEKPLTVNAAQTKKLVATAKQKGVFLMEAVWTRFFPATKQVQQLVTEGAIGPVRRIVADFSMHSDVEKEWKDSHRLLNMDLAGGALLDLGVYPINWVFQILYHLQSSPSTSSHSTQPSSQNPLPPTVTSSMTKYAPTGCDENTTVLMTFPGYNGGSQGIATTSLRTSSETGPSVRIYGDKGEIQIDGLPCHPDNYRLITVNPGEGSVSRQPKEVRFPVPGGGKGMFYEADECARCLRDGRKESESIGWMESIAIMETMDEVRRQNGLVYPERIESAEYPLEGF